jgi:hypothetical protein
MECGPFGREVVVVVSAVGRQLLQPENNTRRVVVAQGTLFLRAAQAVMLPKKRKFTPIEYENWVPEATRPPEAHQSTSLRAQEDMDAEVAINLVRSEASTLDLNEWVGQRILARRDQYFCPGVIKAAFRDNSVAVDFETEETPLIYSNVLSKGDYDTIISDATPATNQVSRHWQKNSSKL